GLHAEEHRLRPLVGGKEDGVAGRALLPLHRFHGGAPARPARWYVLEARLGEQVAPVEHDTSIDVPRDPKGHAVDDVRVPDAAEEAGRVYGAGAGEVWVERFEGVDRRELG